MHSSLFCSMVRNVGREEVTTEWRSTLQPPHGFEKNHNLQFKSMDSRWKRKVGDLHVFPKRHHAERQEKQQNKFRLVAHIFLTNICNSNF